MMFPGCFGIPSVFSFTSGVCAKCGGFDECQRQSHAALTRVDPALVADLLQQHRNYRNGTDPEVYREVTTTREEPGRKTKVETVDHPLSDMQERQIASMSKKAGEYLRKLYRRGFEKTMGEVVERGDNPFPAMNHRPYHLAYECLGRGCVSKGYLTAMFQNELGWSGKSARPQTTVVWDVLLALGLAVEDGAYLAPAPNVPCQNRNNRMFRRAS